MRMTHGCGGEPHRCVCGARLIEQSRARIRSFITQRFRAAELERLVVALLEAEGYSTHRTPAGPDGGVDVLAGRGPMGFDPPHLCIQVKSRGRPVDVRVVRELQGAMSRFKADRGLLVSWSGFTPHARKEARQVWFQIRLWDSDDVLGALFKYYDRLPEDIRAELPLRRLWILVPETEGE